MSRFTTQTPNFQKWFKQSKVVGPDSKPLRVYHGTTHDLETFTKRMANPRNHFGQAMYFTDHTGDVGSNYASESGPDLKNRIDYEADRIANKRQRLTWEQAQEKARQKLVGPGPRTLPVYLSLQNPVRIHTKNPTFLDWNQDYDEEGNEVGEPTGKAVDLTRAIVSAGKKYVPYNRGFAPEVLVQELMDNGLWEGMSAHKVDDLLRHSDHTLALMDERGEDALGNFLQNVWKHMGYDGIIHDTDRFAGMAGAGEATHYVVWDPKKIKSAIGNTTFDSKSRYFAKSAGFLTFPHFGVEAPHSEPLTLRSDQTHVVERMDLQHGTDANPARSGGVMFASSKSNAPMPGAERKESGFAVIHPHIEGLEDLHSVRDHEAQHSVFNWIAQKHGYHMSRKIARHLIDNVLSPNEQKAVHALARVNGYAKDEPLYHEEALATLQSFLISPKRRRFFFSQFPTIKGKEIQRKVHGIYKKAWRKLMSAAPELTPEHLLGKVELDTPQRLDKAEVDHASQNYRDEHGNYTDLDLLKIPPSTSHKWPQYRKRFEEALSSRFLMPGQELQTIEVPVGTEGVNDVKNHWRYHMYRQMIREGNEVPPVFVANRNGRLYVIDGNHRLAAAKAEGLKSLEGRIAVNLFKKTEENGDVDRLMYSEDPADRKLALRLPGVTEEHLSTAMSDPDESVRLMALNHDAVTPAVVAVAAYDLSPKVQEAAIQHPCFTSVTAGTMLEHPSRRVRCILASRDCLTGDQIAAMYSSALSDLGIKLALLDRLSCPAFVLKEAVLSAKDSDSADNLKLALAAVDHDSMPENVLKTVASSEEYALPLRTAAIEALSLRSGEEDD